MYRWRSTGNAELGAQRGAAGRLLSSGEKHVIRRSEGL